jgi:hypothetical protein
MAKKKENFLTPQQQLFLSSYTDPKSPTFANAYQSALKANYSKDYAENITGQLPEWLSENLGDMRRLRKAEKNLEEVQNLPVVNEEGKVDVQLVGARSKVDIFLAERLDKNKYSPRAELTGNNGKPLLIQFDVALTSPTPEDNS